MESLWNRFENDMLYYKNKKELRFMFKDIWKVCIESLRVYEGNIKLFRQETEKKEFIKHLGKLSSDLKIKREDNEREAVLKMYMPWRE